MELRSVRKKKASLQDLVFIAVVILVFAVGTLISYKIYNEFNTEVQASSVFTTRGKTASTQIENMYPNVIDNSFLLLVFGLCIVALALAAMVRVHPIFFVFYLIILIIIIFLCGVFSNIYLEIAGTTQFSTLADNLTFITHIMHILPWIVGVFGFILAIIMYKTWQGAQ